MVSLFTYKPDQIEISLEHLKKKWRYNYLGPLWGHCCVLEAESELEIFSTNIQNEIVLRVKSIPIHLALQNTRYILVISK